MEWLDKVLLLIGGGGIGVVANYLIQRLQAKNEKKTIDQTGWQVIYDRLDQDNTRLRSKVEKDADRIDRLERELLELRVKVQLMESAHYDLPVPQWLKDTNLVMLSINEKYTEVFGKTPEEYVGNTDFDVWPDEIAKAFTKNDQWVMRTKKTLNRVEPVPMPDGSVSNWRILKYPRYAGNVVIGIGGIAFEEIELNDKHGD